MPKFTITYWNPLLPENGGKSHGPFRMDVGCVVLEVSLPDRTDGAPTLSAREEIWNT